ncbi:hypothetical protein OH77DRAFT_1513089 [Trametes cingulata]|nr:hypothetical protein OH77DRAFT_1513089 [Trametes cingulata]
MDSASKLSVSNDYIRERFAKLAPIEIFWRDRQPFLEDHGYTLRSRYRPGWIPSWRRDPAVDVFMAEDHLTCHPFRPNLMDARRISDGKLVQLKRVPSDSQELEIMTFLSSRRLRQDPRNHAVPLLDLLHDPKDPDFTYMVMPYLRYIDSPPFETVQSIIDCVTQLLEGLAFLHEQGVAHRDCAFKNVMMDAEKVFPRSFHPMADVCLPQQIYVLAPIVPRWRARPTYFFVDFGISSRFLPSDHNRLVLGRDGLDQEVPELSDDIPYDPFKADVFILGNLFAKEFVQKYKNVDTLYPLVRSMINPDPALRPTAAEALRQWRELLQSSPYIERFLHYASRPCPRSESNAASAFYSVVAFHVGNLAVSNAPQLRAGSYHKLQVVVHWQSALVIAVKPVHLQAKPSSSSLSRRRQPRRPSHLPFPLLYRRPPLPPASCGEQYSPRPPRSRNHQLATSVTHKDRTRALSRCRTSLLVRTEDAPKGAGLSVIGQGQLAAAKRCPTPTPSPTGTMAQSESIADYRRMGDDIFAHLSPIEVFWRDRQPFFMSHGYTLRPRYRPGWEPSWKLNPELKVFNAEDHLSMHMMRPHLMDARRISDNKLVLLKQVRRDSRELQITPYLSSHPLRRDPRNHSIPILDVLHDPQDDNWSYLVMPFLRYIDDPPFETVGDILECCEQLLQGLVFLHEHGVAHRDCTYRNIMMDADALYPQGFHPMSDVCLPNSINQRAPVLSRKDVPVTYYYVDFGISSHFAPEETDRLVIGTSGLDQEVPELSDESPYDPFKVDVFILGNMFRRVFTDKITNVNVLNPLNYEMTNPNPAKRPTAAEALRLWQKLRRDVCTFKTAWRPRPRKEPWVATALFDTMSLCFATYYLFF